MGLSLHAGTYYSNTKTNGDCFIIFICNVNFQTGALNSVTTNPIYVCILYSSTSVGTYCTCRKSALKCRYLCMSAYVTQKAMLIIISYSVYTHND